MRSLFFSLFVILRSSFQTRAALQVEVLALRHQINVLRRSLGGRVRVNRADRLLWVWLSRLWSGWRSFLVIVLPEPPPEAKAYLQEARRRHYEEWPGHPLRALDGQTPREAAKDRLGRQRLIDLMREMEYMDQRRAHPGYPLTTGTR